MPEHDATYTIGGKTYPRVCYGAELPICVIGPSWEQIRDHGAEREYCPSCQVASGSYHGSYFGLARGCAIAKPEPVDGPCHDCGAQPGAYHDPGCDAERCPACGDQSISCRCDAEDDDDDE